MGRHPLVWARQAQHCHLLLVGSAHANLRARNHDRIVLSILRPDCLNRLVAHFAELSGARVRA